MAGPADGVTVFARSKARRSRRRPATVRLLLAFLALVVAAGGLWLASRGDGGKTIDRPAPARSNVTVAAPVATSAPAVGVGVGPTRVAEGVPVGFAHSEPGAIAAATAYATVLNGPAVIDAARSDLVLGALATAEAKDELSAAYRQGAELIQRNLDLSRSGTTDVLFRGVPVGYRVDSYGGDTAELSIWVVSLTGSPTVVPSQSWHTNRFSLAWEAGDWKVGSLSSELGPVPSTRVSSIATPATDLLRLAGQFKAYAHAHRP